MGRSWSPCEFEMKVNGRLIYLFSTRRRRTLFCAFTISSLCAARTNVRIFFTSKIVATVLIIDTQAFIAGREKKQRPDPITRGGHRQTTRDSFGRFYTFAPHAQVALQLLHVSMI